MRAFSCPSCLRLAPFESVCCLHCWADHAFDWATRDLLALRPTGPDGGLEVVGDGRGRERCSNRELIECNGLAAAGPGLCPACQLTRTRPGDDDAAGLAQFREAERAKRRLVFELGELGLPIRPRNGSDGGLAFDMLSSSVDPVTTGHADGVVTIDLAETDDAHREAMRMQMSEPYRTVLGHLRHEVGHYYEQVVVRSAEDRARFRELFGDERADYQEAMARHYSEGAPPDWEDHGVSAYATMHPWEDWAETFAHYLHINDTLQTAAAYGVQVGGPQDIQTADDPSLTSEPRAVAGEDVPSLLDQWLPLTYALNALSRSMGAEDLYPFVLSPKAIEKLELVDELVGAVAADRDAAGV